MLKKLVCFSLVLAAGVSSGDENKTPVSFYGFVLPTMIGASSAVESFSNPNMSAFTAAGNPVLASHAAMPRGTFQLAQSRLGMVAKPAEGTSALIEMDFIDFTKSSPTTAALPRLRRAIVDFQATDHLLLRIGQDWDLASPLAPHTFNLVGHFFESGDIGFMRIQAQAIYTDGPWEHAFSLGTPGNNNTNTDAGLELGITPTVAARESYRFEDKTRVGLSAIATNVRPSTTSNTHIFAGAATAFFETNFGDTELRTEAYYGQNTNNIGMLGLGFGTATVTHIREAGAYVTLRTKIGGHAAVFGGAGGSWVLNPEDVLPSYATVAGVTALAGRGPGIRSNWTARVGAEWLPNEKLKFFVEAALLATRHRLQPADEAVLDTRRTAFVGQVGTMATF